MPLVFLLVMTHQVYIKTIEDYANMCYFKFNKSKLSMLACQDLMSESMFANFTRILAQTSTSKYVEACLYSSKTNSL